MGERFWAGALLGYGLTVIYGSLALVVAAYLTGCGAAVDEEPDGCLWDGVYGIQSTALPPCEGSATVWKTFHSVRSSCSYAADGGYTFISCDPTDPTVLTCDGWSEITDASSPNYGCSVDMRVFRLRANP